MGGGDINPKGTSGRPPDEVGLTTTAAGIYGRERVKVLTPHGLEKERVNTSAASVQVMFSLSKIILICRGDNVRRFKGHYLHSECEMLHNRECQRATVKLQMQYLVWGIEKWSLGQSANKVLLWSHCKHVWVVPQLEDIWAIKTFTLHLIFWHLLCGASSSDELFFSQA